MKTIQVFIVVALTTVAGSAQTPPIGGAKAAQLKVEITEVVYGDGTVASG